MYRNLDPKFARKHRGGLLYALALTGLLGTACVPTQNPADPDEAPDINYNATELKDAKFIGSIPAIDNKVVELMTGKFPGVAIGIVAEGEVKYLKGYGLANTKVGQQVPFKKKTVGGLGSVSKSLTATAIMRLVEKGDINLDASIVTYFPHAVPASWNPVTVRQLLGHRGGFVKDPNWAQAGALSGAQIDLSFALDKASQHPRYAVFEFMLAANGQSKPALYDKYNYSNIGYTILGAIIDWVTLGGGFPSHEQGYERFVWSQLTRAKGQFNDDAALTAVLDHWWRAGDILNEAKNYNADDTENNTKRSGWQSAAGGWCMTIGDLARYMNALNSGQIVTPASLLQMRQNQSDFGEIKYGLGFFLANENGKVAYSHGGVIDGFRCQFTMWPNDGVGVVVMANRDAQGVGGIANEVGRLYMEGHTEIVLSRADRAEMKTSRFDVSKNHFARAQAALERSMGGYDYDSVGNLLQGVDRQSSAAHVLVQRVNGDTSRTEEISQSFLDVLRTDGKVGSYRGR